MAQLRETALQTSRFLEDFMQSQRNKLHALMTRAQAPTAQQSAFIVKAILEDLTLQQNKLLELIESEESLSEILIASVLSTIKFYLDQESYRTEAGVIAADVPVH